jgi:hypothetical protein
MLTSETSAFLSRSVHLTLSLPLLSFIALCLLTSPLGVLGGHLNGHPVGQFILNRFLKNFNLQKRFRVTLIALPLIPDYVTHRIARYADRIINLPADPSQGWELLEKLQLDILLFPDWQPFPDTQSLFFQSSRIAPVQVCLFVRGTSCSSVAIDYYLLPSDLQESYLKTTERQSPGETAGGGVGINQIYLERFSEQVVLLDWPVFTSSSILGIISPASDDAFTASPSSSVPPREDDTVDNQFVPDELEGKVFFDGQPTALLPLDPSYLHPLMDEALLTLLRSISDLQLIIVIPEIFAKVLPSSTPQSPSLSEYEIKPRYLSIEWAKKLVRRLWSKSENRNFHQRIRLFPHPLSDKRLTQLMKQVDVILDSFPFGNSLYPLALGLSVGTPIVTLQSGTLFTRTATAHEELDLRQFLFSRREEFSQNIIYQHIVQTTNLSLPWLPSISPLCSYYQKLGIADELVGQSVRGYVELAQEIIVNKEKSYKIRIKILDSLDSYLASKRGSGGETRADSVTQWAQSMNTFDETMKDIEK